MFCHLGAAFLFPSTSTSATTTLCLPAFVASSGDRRFASQTEEAVAAVLRRGGRCGGGVDEIAEDIRAKMAAVLAALTIRRRAGLAH